MVGNNGLSSYCGADYDDGFSSFSDEKFGKSLIQHKLLTVFLPFIYMAIVNYSKDAEVEEDENELYLTEEEKRKRRKILL